jgi:hypothetical protein
MTTRAAAVGGPARPVSRWPLLLIAAPAAVAVWSGWVGLGTLCGFGIVHPLPGIADGFKLNTAITLPVGVEAYGAYALGAWLTPGTAPAARAFARRSALGALALGMAGQVIYHLLAAWRAPVAPWPVVMLVSCLPVLTLGFGAALTHLLRTAPRPAPAAAAPLAGDSAAELRTEVDSVRAALDSRVRALQDRHAAAAADLERSIHAVRDVLRAEIKAVRDATGDGRPGPAAPVDRTALVAELADEIRDAITAGERWAPDYDALMTRTGYRRSWCEKAVRDARTLAFSGPAETRTGDDRTGTGPGRRTDDTPTDAPQAIAA